MRVLSEITKAVLCSYSHPASQGRLKSLGSVLDAPVEKQQQQQQEFLTSSAHGGRGINWGRESRHMLPFALLDFRAISLFLVGHRYNLISLAQTVQ